MINAYPKQPFGLESYVERTRSGPCFICEIVAAPDKSGHYVLFEDEHAIVFLNRYPTLFGYTLVAPRRHREQVTGDFTEAEYVELQKLVYHVSEALRAELAPERVYILSLGSQQGNRHVHWHIAPLPPGVPYVEQQLAALDLNRGVLDIPEEELRRLADRLRGHLHSEGPR